MIDNIDIEILKILQKDGRSSASDIGKSVGLSAPAAGDRINLHNELHKIEAFAKYKKISFEQLIKKLILDASVNK